MTSQLLIFLDGYNLAFISVPVGCMLRVLTLPFGPDHL